MQIPRTVGIIELLLPDEVGVEILHALPSGGIVRQGLPLAVQLAIAQGRLVQARLLTRVIRRLLGQQVIHPVRVGGDAAGGHQGPGLLLLQHGGEPCLLAQELGAGGKVLGELGQQGDQPLPDLALAIAGGESGQAGGVIPRRQGERFQCPVEVFQ
ncbi:hypothetical protein D3C87_761160 [compost metagenome]